MRAYHLSTLLFSALAAGSALAQPLTLPTPPNPPLEREIVEPPSAPPSAQEQLLNSMGGSGATGPNSIGILPLRYTGFDRRTWRDTPFRQVLELITNLPYRMNSAAQHVLARNLLVSVADVPPGDNGGEEMLVRRVEALIALGNVMDAAALARAAPNAPNDERLAKAEIEAELYAGQIEAACIDMRAFAPNFQSEWARVGILLCQQRDGEAVEGVPELNYDLLGPLVRIGGNPIPANTQDALPAALVAAAYEQRMPPELRVEAAFAAGRASALDGDKLTAIFKETPSFAAPPESAPTDGASATALYKAIIAATDPGQKLTLAERGLLSPAGVLDKVGVAIVGALRNVQPSADLSPYAARFATLFYAINDVETATAWAKLATGSEGALWPYRVLLKQASPTGIAEWQEQSGLDPARAARIQLILSAFGVTRPPLATQPVAGEEFEDVPLRELLALDQSAKDVLIGATVLRALAVLGHDGPALTHPLALKRALAAIDSVSMHDEARALAFEAIASATLAPRNPMRNAKGP